jgi:ribosome maturation protein SDO1
MSNQVVARLKGFEVLVDQDKAMSFIDGQDISIEDVLETEEIFTNLQKGNRASSLDLKKAFKTDDFKEVTKIILKDGELQIDAQKRKELLEEKKKQIVHEIASSAVDPKTNIPHPPDRVQAALDQANVKIDLNKSNQEQIKEIIPKINNILPISFQKITLDILIPAKVAGKCYGIVSKYHGARQEYDNSGNLKVQVELSGADKERLKNELFKVAGSDIEIAER